MWRGFSFLSIADIYWATHVVSTSGNYWVKVEHYPMYSIRDDPAKATTSPTLGNYINTEVNICR